MKWLLFTLMLLKSMGSAGESLAPAAGLALPQEDAGGTARAMAMGSAYAGVAEGAAALLWNPGGLGGLTHSELGAHHNSALGEAFRETFLLALPAGTRGAVAGAFHYSDYGGFEGRDSEGGLTQGYSAQALGLKLGWGQALSGNLRLGAAAQYARQNLAEATYHSLSADLGALAFLSEQWRLGISYCNLGTSLAGFTRASSLRLGLAWEKPSTQGHGLLLAVAGQFQAGGERTLQAGLEQRYEILTLRAGYVQDLGETGLEGLHGVSAGFGLKLGRFVLDYAFLPYGQLGASHRLSLTLEFAAPAAAPEQAPLLKLGASKAGEIRKLRSQVMQEPGNAIAWWNLGKLYNEAGKFDWAKTCFEEAIHLNPSPRARAWFERFKSLHP